MNQKNTSWKEKFENNNKGHKYPLTDEVVYSNMIYKYYKPYKLYEYLKDRIKHLINHNTKILCKIIHIPYPYQLTALPK